MCALKNIMFSSTDSPKIPILPWSLIFCLSQTYEEALEAQKAKKEARKPSKAKNSEVNKKKKWKKSNKGDSTDKNDAVSDVVMESHHNALANKTKISDSRYFTTGSLT